MLQLELNMDAEIVIPNKNADEVAKFVSQPKEIILKYQAVKGEEDDEDQHVGVDGEREEQWLVEAVRSQFVFLPCWFLVWQKRIEARIDGVAKRFGNWGGFHAAQFIRDECEKYRLGISIEEIQELGNFLSILQ